MIEFQVTTGYRPPQEPGVPNSVALAPWGKFRSVEQTQPTSLDFLFLPARKGTVKVISCVIALQAWDISQNLAGILGYSRFLIWIVLISLLGLHKVKVMCCRKILRYTGNTGNGEHGDITLKGQKEIKSDYLALPMPDCQSLENEHGTQKTLGVQEELSFSKGWSFQVPAYVQSSSIKATPIPYMVEK